MTRLNPLGQPIGDAVANWHPRERPARTAMIGRLSRLEPLDAEAHGEALYAALSEDRGGGLYTYIPLEPFASPAALKAWAQAMAGERDPMLFAICDFEGRAKGFAAFMRIAPEAGSMEVGYVVFSPALQRTALATEAMYLMMKRAFDELGYRRYEWKCDALNAASRAAAERLGFRYEGTFRQALVMKGRNRDTAWFSIIDSEWPRIGAALEAWLAPENFDSEGRQRARLGALMAEAAPIPR